MYTEIKTSEIAEIEKFVRDHAETLGENQIVIRKKDHSLVAELFDSNEASI